MSLRKLILFSMVAVFCLDRSAFSQVNGVEIAGGETAQVFGGKEPVVKVIDVEGKEVASIPIEKDPGKFIYSKSANTLYVVHDEKKGEHFISAVNLTTNRVDKQIKVGAGASVELLFSNDQHRLFCYTAGKQLLPVGDSLDLPYEPAISEIDTASNELVTAYNWFDKFRADVPRKRWVYEGHLIAASDKGYLVTTSSAFLSTRSETNLLYFQAILLDLLS